MSNTITVLLDASFVLAVTGAALIYPPSALIVGALYLLGQAIVADRRSSEVPK